MRLVIASSAISLTLLFAASTACSAPPAYVIDVSQAEAAWRAEVKFTDTAHSPVTLIYDDEAGPPWKPLFEKSPDGRWILYVQKTGSGDNVAWLYMVDDVGRVLRNETRLDWQAWRFSNSISNIHHFQLYHCGIDDWKWIDATTLAFTLSGKAKEESGRGVRHRLRYNTASGAITKAETKDESGRGSRNAPAAPPTPPGVRVRTGRFQSDH